MGEYEFTISLRIRHPNIDPSSITEQLGIEPQHAWRAGDARRDSSGDGVKGVYRESYWMGRLMDEPQVSSGRLSVESLLARLLPQLRRAQCLLDRLAGEAGVAELHVSLFARGDFQLELAGELVAALGRSHLGVTFEIHPHPQPVHDPSAVN
jgi:hypothetical protein